MKKIGRVILLDSTTNISYIDKDIVDIEYSYSESDRPTLIVGFKEAQKLFPKITILDKEINKNTFVTFSPNELNIAFRDDVDKFMENIYELYISDFEYHFIDIIIDEIQVYGDLLSFINSRDTCFYKYDTFLYFINKNENIIYGLDLNYMNELGIDIEDFLSFIKLRTDFYFEETHDENSLLKKHETMVKKNIEPKYLTIFLNNNN